MELKPLVDIDKNSIVKVSKIDGGKNVKERLENMGIRKGQKISKLSSHFWRGPITVSVGRGKVAVGYGLARKIIVEVQ